MMAWKASILTLGVYHLFCFSFTVAVPVDTASDDLAGGISSMIGSVESHVDVPETTTQINPVATAVAPIALVPSVPPDPTLSLSAAFFPPASLSDPLASPPSLVTGTTLETFAHVTTVTETVTMLPSTVTDTVIINPTSLNAPATPSSSKTTWAAPAQMTDLSAFNISAFATGQRNVEIVRGIPMGASAILSAAIAQATLGSLPIWDNSTSVIQVLYPANSIDPASEPKGGADFYAAPLQPVSTAQNVTLEYSVFFPRDFDWVRGGKLPGLYGGHSHCSGGDNALKCFSTRLMWRTAGAGELYLYAPKTKQTLSLCEDPQSVCDTAYGLSVGRGSFDFARGAWTHVKQTVSLNTPGQQDGGFKLEVNGILVINRTDIFYRDIPTPTVSNNPHCGSDQAVHPSATMNHQSTSTAGGLFGLLFGRISPRHRNIHLGRSDLKVGLPTTFDEPAAGLEVGDNQKQWVAGGQPIISDVQAAVEQSPSAVVGFTGLFFSTFFGGHELRYATPVNQFAWFKGFTMTLNS